jgi:hypothetical protein
MIKRMIMSLLQLESLGLNTGLMGERESVS